MTTWLGIDPGLAIVGWAILRDNSELMPILVDYGTIETSKNLSTAQRLIEIERDLKELIAEYKPGKIAVEMPFFNRQIKAAGGVLQALGIINLVSCRDGGIEPIFLHQASWKCHLVHGKATKAEVAEQIKYLFGLTKMPINDSVDAIAIAYAAFSGVRNQIS
ncbi:crossover junction endodeoxyribonuclease RuvC [Microcystis aeruginosa NIES-4325]|uniref:Crossover junction endodeoxyribonuclease RuvC n=1 Tax=Microcystis aeruginosa NIES-4325 TaxID=2569534 RepID=A0A5J4F756_MICAE|nr:crossover junction endodeoxyribonuclease RuvC [Microcystis aeruginosa]GEA26803.1 crossover junction endodeoxyribonuclease RuvC [Microcystis aeruginosa NIES-4325]